MKTNNKLYQLVNINQITLHMLLYSCIPLICAVSFFNILSVDSIYDAFRHKMLIFHKIVKIVDKIITIHEFCLVIELHGNKLCRIIFHFPFFLAAFAKNLRWILIHRLSLFVSLVFTITNYWQYVGLFEEKFANYFFL